MRQRQGLRSCSSHSHPCKSALCQPEPPPPGHPHPFKATRRPCAHTQQGDPDFQTAMLGDASTRFFLLIPVHETHSPGVSTVSMRRFHVIKEGGHKSSNPDETLVLRAAHLSGVLNTCPVGNWDLHSKSRNCICLLTWGLFFPPDAGKLF